MNEKCKYCDYVSKCSRICEYNSYLCKVHRSFPKVVDKSYEQLQQENKQLNGAVQTYEILLKTNVEENKQLKEELECTIGIVEHNRIINKKNREIQQLKIQQKKFIKYMNDTIEDLETENVDDEEIKGYLIQRIYTFKEILRKYKSIMGVSDENNKQ